jgi:hypothetical protein
MEGLNRAMWTGVPAPRRVSGNKKVARGASVFLRAPLVQRCLGLVPRQRHWSDRGLHPVPLTRHDFRSHRVPGVLAKTARTPGYLLQPLSRRRKLQSPGHRQECLCHIAFRVPLTRHDFRSHRVPGVLAKNARTPGYLLESLSRRRNIQSPRHRQECAYHIAFRLWQRRVLPITSAANVAPTLLSVSRGCASA